MTPRAADLDSRHRGSRARAAAGSLLQSASRGVAIVFGVLLAAYLARRLAVTDYGSYSVALVFTSWIGIVLGTATTVGSVRLLAAHEHGRRFAVTMLQAACGAGIIAWALTALAAPVVAGMLQTPPLAVLLQIVAADLPLGAMASVYSGVLTGEGRFALGAGNAIAGSLARLAFVILLLESGMGATGAALSVPLASGIQLAYGWFATGVSPFSSDRVPFGRLWGHTRLLAGAALALRISQRMDLLAVKLLSGSAVMTGHYAGAQSVAAGPQLAFQGSPGVITQAVASARANGHHDVAVDLAGTFLRTTMAYAGLIIAMSGLAREATLLLLGQAYAPAGPVLAVLLWAAAFRVLSNAARAIIAAVGEQASIVRALALSIVCGAGMYALVIPSGGIIAGALATAVLSLAVCVLSVSAALRLMDMSFPWMSLARVAAASAVAMLVAALLPGTGFFVVARGAMATVVYATVLLLLREWRPKRADAVTLFGSLQQALTGPQRQVDSK